MMFAQPHGLGLIPDWQFSEDPAINIKLNPHCKIPGDWTNGQRTIQPLSYVPQRIQGDPLACTNGQAPCCPGLPCTSLTGLGITKARWIDPPHGLGFGFDSWAWTNRKWLVIGGVALLGLAVLGGAGALLR